MKNENQKKMNKNIGKISIVLFTLTMAMMAMGLSASATPAGADTSAMNSMLDVAFWVVRILIGAICIFLIATSPARRSGFFSGSG